MFYNLEYEGHLISDCHSTIESVEARADQWWDDRNDDLENGVTKKGYVDIIAYDDDYNELTRYKYTVSTVGYHGDYAEHAYYGV